MGHEGHLSIIGFARNHVNKRFAAIQDHRVFFALGRTVSAHLGVVAANSIPPPSFLLFFTSAAQPTDEAAF